MKKILFYIATITLSIICLFTTTNCVSKDKYNLVEITGLNGITVESYDYNYIILKSDGTYKVQNKAKSNGVVTKQTGKYLIKEDNTVILSDSDNGNNYLLYSGETIVCQNDKIIVSASIAGYGKIGMIYSK